MKLSGNTVLVTGAGTGMGLEAARRFSALGNRVVMVARNRERLEAAAAGLAGADPYACDIADPEQVAGLLSHLDQQHPQLNAVLLNAAVTHTYELFGPEDMVAHADEEMRVNYLSAVRLAQALEPRLARRPAAALILTTSGAALAPDISNPTYSATKAALHSLAQSMRLVLQRRGSSIQVFELMAPLVDSPFAKDVHSDQKVSPSFVIDALLTGLEQDRLEIRPGLTEDLYQLLRRSPEDALATVNAATNA